MTKTAADDSVLSASLPQVGPVVKLKSSTDDKASNLGKGGKEAEPAGTATESFAEEKELIAQIETTAEELDKKAIEVVEKELSDVKASQPAPKLPPDVEDAGVVNPQEEADNVIKNGPTLNLPISELEYKQGLKTGAKGRWYRQEKEMVGVKGILALALWVGRLVKRAHKKAVSVIFRKGN